MEAGVWALHIMFGRWMVAQWYLANMNPTELTVLLYPPQWPILQWRDFTVAHYFLLCFLNQYQALTLHCDWCNLIWYITNKVLMNAYLMDEFEEDGFTTGDVQWVSMVSTQVNNMTQGKWLRQFPHGSVVWTVIILCTRGNNEWARNWGGDGCRARV